MKPKKQERQGHEERARRAQCSPAPKRAGKKDKDRSMRTRWGGKEKEAAVGQGVMTMTRGERAAKKTKQCGI